MQVRSAADPLAQRDAAEMRLGLGDCFQEWQTKGHSSDFAA
jgi:hypothetical protein